MKQTIIWKLKLFACCLELKLNLTNRTDRELGPFEVSLSQNVSYGDRVVMINGLQSMAIHFV